jgi:hypothetical protein
MSSQASSGTAVLSNTALACIPICFGLFVSAACIYAYRFVCIPIFFKNLRHKGQDKRLLSRPFWKGPYVAGRFFKGRFHVQIQSKCKIVILFLHKDLLLKGMGSGNIYKPVCIYACRTYKQAVTYTKSIYFNPILYLSSIFKDLSGNVYVNFKLESHIMESGKTRAYRQNIRTRTRHIIPTNAYGNKIYICMYLGICIGTLLWDVWILILPEANKIYDTDSNSAHEVRASELKLKKGRLSKSKRLMWEIWKFSWYYPRGGRWEV